MNQPIPPHDEAATVGPRCGNNPNARLTGGDRKAIAEFKAYLADRATTPVTAAVRDSLGALVDKLIERCPDHGCVEPEWEDGCHCEIVPHLRHLADEAQPGTTPTASSPCSVPDPCADGELCDRHETEQAHAEGEHELCGVTCEVQFPAEALRNFVIAKGYPGTAGALDELLRRAGQPTASVPDAERRARYEAAFGPNMRLGLQDAELHDEPGAQRINEWIDWITNVVMAVADAELEGAETATEYGIRVPGADWPEDGVLQDGDTFNLKDQQGRLLRYRDCWPDAVLVSRPVRRGEWTEAE
ncbi:hypothetical protein SAZ11_08110 [Streptomyces sp. FXJ1.4098]|nr:hypothetical protein [Streptomyces sp. FXJ1.4098]